MNVLVLRPLQFQKENKQTVARNITAQVKVFRPCVTIVYLQCLKPLFVFFSLCKCHSLEISHGKANSLRGKCYFSLPFGNFLLGKCKTEIMGKR